MPVPQASPLYVVDTEGALVSTKITATVVLEQQIVSSYCRTYQGMEQ